MYKKLSVPGVLAELLRDFLEQNQLKMPEIEKTLDGFIHQQRMPMEVWWDVLEKIHQHHFIPALGIHIGRTIQPYHVSVLGYLALSSPNFQKFFGCFQHFQPLLQNSASVSIHMEDQRFCIIWKAVIKKQPQLSNEILVAGTISLIQKILDQHDFNPLLIEFTAPSPHDITVYEKLLGCPVQFGSDLLKIWLPLDLLFVPIKGSDPHLKSLLDKQAEALLLALPNPDPFLNEIQSAIVELLQDGEPTAARVADKLDCSLRTLYRRIEEHDLQYSILLSNTRFELARTYLSNQKLGLPEISFLLGYSEQSAFSRAFRIWADCSPSDYRRKVKKNLVT